MRDSPQTLVFGLIDNDDWLGLILARSNRLGIPFLRLDLEDILLGLVAWSFEVDVRGKAFGGFVCAHCDCLILCLVFDVG